MSIQYIEPLSRGISRMSRALFSPFDLKKWFVVGFTAFLAGLADVELSGGVPDLNITKRLKFDVEEILYFPQKAWEWLTNNPGWAILIAIALFLFCVLIVVITWFSARGKFLLPISYAMRSFSVEFLEQFGPEYRIFPRPDINPPDTQQATV